MQRLRREAGRYVRKDSVTTEMLRIALGSLKQRCHRGNHEIIVKYDSPTPGYPDMERCEGCALYLACQTAGKTQAYHDDFEENGGHAPTQSKYACRKQTQRIKFLYHDTCICEYDMDAHMLTGHGTYGWSQSTNQNIHKCLEALQDLGYITADMQYELLQYVRRDGKGTIDHEAPWYPTR